MTLGSKVAMISGNSEAGFETSPTVQLVPAGCHVFSTIVFGGVSRKN